MTREERHIAVLSRLLENMDVYDSIQPTTERKKAIKAAIQALSQEPCDDAIDREYLFKVLDDFCGHDRTATITLDTLADLVYDMPSVTQKSGKCKNCKYFEYDSVAKVNGIPLIVAHEICNKWGDGCQTSEDGYCFLYEPQESEEVE